MRPSDLSRHVIITATLMLAAFTAVHGERPLTGKKLEEAVAYATLAKKGQEAPAVVIEDLSGRKYDLAAMKGRVVVLYFFDLKHRHTVVGIKREVEEFVLPFVQNWPETVVLSIGKGATREAIEAMKKETEVKVPLVADPDHILFQKFASGYTPRFFVIGRDGKVAFERTGVHEMKGVKGLREALTEQLAVKVKAE
jgi:peroxiredoxin